MFWCVGTHVYGTHVYGTSTSKFWARGVRVWPTRASLAREEHDVQDLVVVATTSNVWTRSFLQTRAFPDVRGHPEAPHLRSCAQDRSGRASDAKALKILRDATADMTAPCLRLELLQFALELDEYFELALVEHSVKLALHFMSLRLVEKRAT